MIQRGGFFKPCKGFFIISLTQIAKVVEHTGVVDAGHFALLSGLDEPVIGSLKILLHACALKIRNGYLALRHSIASLGSGEQIGKIALGGHFRGFLRQSKGSSQQQHNSQQKCNQLLHGSISSFHQAAILQSRVLHPLLIR